MDGFACRPIGVALEHRFHSGWLIAKDVVTSVHRAKNLIHGGKQDAADSSAQTGGAGTLSRNSKVSISGRMIAFLEW
jgi:hypothetical protein